MTELLYREEVYEIVGAAIEVHKELGHGFLEPVFQEALGYEWSDRSVPFVEQASMRIKYKNRVLKKEYIADYVCYEKIIVEIKALEKLTGREESQVLNYLKASNHRVGVLINFGSQGKLEWKRMVL